MPDPSKATSTAFPAPDRSEDPRQDLHTIIDLVREMDLGQHAQLEATGLMREEIGTLHGLLGHLIQILTAEQPKSEGPSLRELLSHIIEHQREMTRLLKETVAASGRIETHLNHPEALSPAKVS